jgi:hypothetical protein
MKLPTFNYDDIPLSMLLRAAGVSLDDESTYLTQQEH